MSHFGDKYVTLFDERRGGPLDGAGERESTPCDALGGEDCWPLNCAHMCTAVCIVGVERAFAAVKDDGGDALQCFGCLCCVC